MIARTWRDGQETTQTDLGGSPPAGFAHFTAMQVRSGRVRGLDLHLRRLIDATARLYGRHLSPDLLRDRMRQALAAGPADVSMTVAIQPVEGEFHPPIDGAGAGVHVHVQTSSPANGPTGPVGLMLVEHERFMPDVKHIGEGAKTYYLWQAVAAGMDDAAFVNRAGHLSEATIWNLAFFDGTSVLWPSADKLLGTTMQVVQRGLDLLGVPQREVHVHPTDLPKLSAVVMNSWTPGVAVYRIDHHHLRLEESFIALLHEAYRQESETSP